MSPIVSAAHGAWNASALAIGAHLLDCLVCHPNERYCPEAQELYASEDAAWEAYAAAKRGEAAA